MEILKFRFSFSFWIERAEMATELRDEFGVVRKYYGCNTKSTPVSPVTPVMSPDLISYSRSSS